VPDKYLTEFSEVGEYHLFAKLYGWSPDIVDGLDHRLSKMLKIMLNKEGK
jgi:hypothetical protein